MPTNDPTNDRYNPPGNLSDDFEKYNFGELEINEFLVKHYQEDDVAEEKPEKQLLQEDKENVNDK